MPIASYIAGKGHIGAGDGAWQKVAPDRGVETSMGWSLAGGGAWFF